MTRRTIVILLASVLVASCATSNQPVAVAEVERDILHIYPDGKMVFDGRVMNKEDVVIYDDGRGGERAAVKLIVPLSRNHTQPYTDIYRDTIIVDREVIDELDKEGG